MERDEIEEKLAQTKTLFMVQNTPRVDLLLKQIKLLDRFLKQGHSLVSGPCLLYELDNEICCKGFTDKIIVGRGMECELPLLKPGLSRMHFQLEVGPQGNTVSDLDSKNGTKVNDTEIKSQVLVPGDVINAGDVLFIYLED
ncbi:MAG: hypothetical protein ACI9TH_001965 [Kiritimatiellia bacterium]|jgi:hypothetical protein